MENIDVIALGGNAILPVGKTGTIREQFIVTRVTMEQIAELIKAGRTVVISHGNGPIVGNIVLRNEAARNIIPPMPLDICGADSQGGIGYMIQQTLCNILYEEGINKDVATVVTQVLVESDDPAFKDPIKPIGPFYSREEAEKLKKEKGWKVVQDSNRGYRRVVASPRPVDIIEKEVVKKLVSEGVIVITVGGGGVPVVKENGELKGTEAVIDKDFASSILASELKAERLIILTSVDAVYERFGTEEAKPIKHLTISQAEEKLKSGEFPPGSMGSKIEASLVFLRSGGKLVIIAHPKNLIDAVAGRSGTIISNT